MAVQRAAEIRVIVVQTAKSPHPEYQHHASAGAIKLLIAADFLTRHGAIEVAGLSS